MQGFLPVAAVFIGGGLGSMARYLVGLAAVRWIGSGFPSGTLIVNAAGSLLMGLLAGLIATHPRSDHNLALFLTTGLMGGFTTYSTFSLDTATLWNRGEVAMTAVYLASTIVVGLVGVFGGLMLSRAA